MTLSEARKAHLGLLEAWNRKAQLLPGQQQPLLEKQQALLDRFEGSYRERSDGDMRRSKTKRRSAVWAKRIIVVGAYAAGTITGVYLWQCSHAYELQSAA